MRVNVYGDGKLGRAIKAKVIKHSSKRILIEFYDNCSEAAITVWFKKVRKDEGGVYTHAKSNTWFYVHHEKKSFRLECKEWFTPEFYEELFNY